MKFVGIAIIDGKFSKLFFNNLKNAESWYWKIFDMQFDEHSIECCKIGHNCNDNADGCNVILEFYN